MELKGTTFYVLKGKKNHIFLSKEEAIEQIKKDKNTDGRLIQADVEPEAWQLESVGWDEIAKYLLGANETKTQ